MFLNRKLTGWGRPAAMLVVLCSLLIAGLCGVQSSSAKESTVQVSREGGPGVERAWSWMRSMLRTPTLIESTSTLTPQREYPADWTGPVGGTWRFGGLGARSGDAPTGVGSPAVATYRRVELRQFVTTDRRYLIGTQPASIDGTFRFASSAPGTKTFQLVAIDTAETGSVERVLAEHAPETGLLRSMASGFGSGTGDDPERTNSYSYDQALALQTALVMDDLPTARVLAAGLMSLQTTSGPQAGGFISSSRQSNPAAGEQIYRTGNTAVALYSLLSYLSRSAPSDPRAPALRTAAERAADWLLRQQLTAGPMSQLLTGGSGGIGTVPAGNGLQRLSFASTEHNVDAWQALTLAGRLLGCRRCADAADRLRGAILAVLWDSDATRFSQGMRPEGRDRVDPLDVNSWGSIFLDAVGRSQQATLSLGHTAAFEVRDGPTIGYLAFRPQPAMPDPVPSVWFEGSFGVALAQARHGDTVGYRTTMSGLRPAQRPDGSFPVATSADAAYELSTASAVAPTAWFILASRPNHPNSLWGPPNPG